MTSSTYNVGVFCGSLRQGSVHASIVRALPGLAPSGMNFTVFDGLDEIPHYNADIQTAAFPQKVLDLAEQVQTLDGIAFVTPEYNYSIPGFLKNAIDWLSRTTPAPFVGKPVVIQTASGGIFGGVRAQYHLRQILVFLDAQAMNKPEIMIPVAQNKISPSGELVDELTKGLIRAQLEAFATFMDRLSVR